MKMLVVAGLAAILAPAAHSAVVQQQYTASVTSVLAASGTVSIGSRSVHLGDALSGVFSYDNAMSGEPAPLPMPSSYEYGYRGTVQDNHVTLSLNGTQVVAPPAANAGSCSPFDLLCSSLPVVMVRYAGPVVVGPTDKLTLHYALPGVSNGGLSPIGGGEVRVSSVDLDFFYSGELSGNALPAQIDFGALRFAQLTLNLSDGTGVLARIDAISPSAVPEPQVWTLMVMGLFAVGAACQVRQRRS
jgi:hypothetical protein